MQEEFLHYLFEHRLLKNTEFDIISSGKKNLDAGPDFFNAKIKIDNTIWAGNVEIHIHSSDWEKHHHNKDKAYDNIILHLVAKHDKKILSTSGQEIPTFTMKYDKKIYQSYQNLLSRKSWIHCDDQIKIVDSITKISYLESLSIERLQRKSSYFENLLEFNNYNWEEAFYQALAIGFGGKVNAIPFELLSKNTPLSILLKHRDNLLQIEAFLFGQAGFLDQNISNDKYYNSLQKEYQYLKKKYQLESIKLELWKFSKIRPYNFPTIKIAWFAQLILNYQSLLSKVLECSNIEDLNKLFNLSASTYWDTHYKFTTDSNQKPKSFGKASKQHLIINTIIPFLYIYSKKTSTEKIEDLCIHWLSSLKPETNNITNHWENIGFENNNALQSQALIELKNEKCNKHKCIDCRIGHKILTLSWNE